MLLAVVLLVLISPMLIVVSVAIIIDTGFPIFYRAERGAYKGDTFRIMKFRSMVKNADRLRDFSTLSCRLSCFIRLFWKKRVN